MKIHASILLFTFFFTSVTLCQAKPIDKLRPRIDEAAMRVEVSEPDESIGNFRGNLVGWLATRARLSPIEETALAKKRHDQLSKQYEVSPPPKSTAKIFERLIHYMPIHQKPFPYRLFVTSASSKAFTTGGGYIYLPKDGLDEMQEKPSTLAFHIARQLGHNARDHAVRANQLVLLKNEIEKIFGKVENETLNKIFGAAVAGADKLLPFLFLRQTEYRADLYAYHLCRNAGFQLEECLDALRIRLLKEYPQFASQKKVSVSHPKGAFLLQRLKRLLLERDGLTTNPETFGLFHHDLKTGKQRLCRAKSIAADRKTVVFVHGSRGDEQSFGDFLQFLAEEKSLADRTILVFRFPNNASLARSGLMLENEIKRVFIDAKNASFICHSSGGLVFRFYAEKRDGAFDRAIFLATPHGGTDLTGLKTFVDIYEFFKGFKLPVARTIVTTLQEGEGQIGYDLRPYSLFLQYLGTDRKIAKRYVCIYGRYFNRTSALAVETAFFALKQVALQKIRDLDSDLLAKHGTKFVQDVKIPREVLNGDLVVSTDSARLTGAKSIRFRLNHQALKSEREVFDRIVKILNN